MLPPVQLLWNQIQTLSVVCKQADSHRQYPSLQFHFTVDPPFTVEIDGAALQSYSRGDSVFLNCSGSRGTVNTVQWLRDGMDLVNEDSTVLELVNVMATQGGEYTCIVNSTEGVANNTVTVHILPEFTVQPASTEVDSGSMTMLTCEAASFPAPTYTWGRVDGGAIRRNVTTNSSSLLFNQVMFGDEGGYYCNATSGGETIQSQAITLTSEHVKWETLGDCLIQCISTHSYSTGCSFCRYDIHSRR